MVGKIIKIFITLSISVVAFYAFYYCKANMNHELWYYLPTTILARIISGFFAIVLLTIILGTPPEDDRRPEP